MIPTIVINLDRDIDRRTTMATRLNALDGPHTFLKALDGRDLSPEEMERYAPRTQWDYPIPLLPGEIACGMSHLTAIAEGLRRDGDFFCVLEDDLLVEPDLAVCLDRHFLASLPAFDVLRLFTHIDRWDKPSKIVKYFQRSHRRSHAAARVGLPGPDLKPGRRAEDSQVHDHDMRADGLRAVP